MLSGPYARATHYEWQRKAEKKTAAFQQIPPSDFENVQKQFSSPLIILYLLPCGKRRCAKMMNKCVFRRRKNAVICEMWHFVTVLGKTLTALV
jgi:hypothetical protein